MPPAPPAPLVERVGQHLRVRAQLWPRGQEPEHGVLQIADDAARGAPSTSLLVESTYDGGPRFRALVHGYGAACAEEVELWEKPGLILVGVGQAVTVLDAESGQVKLRIPMGGYFNSLWLAEDGRDAFICGDEQVVRLVPPGTVSWKKKLGVDGVIVHRAVGLTVFVSAQRRVGGPWVDFLLDRSTGAVTEAPEPEEDEATAPATAARPAVTPAPGAKTTAVRAAAKPGVKSTPPADVPPADADDAEELDDENAVRMVRDDENEPDDE